MLGGDPGILLLEVFLVGVNDSAQLILFVSAVSRGPLQSLLDF